MSARSRHCLGAPDLCRTNGGRCFDGTVLAFHPVAAAKLTCFQCFLSNPAWSDVAMARLLRLIRAFKKMQKSKELVVPSEWHWQGSKEPMTYSIGLKKSFWVKMA